jgi:hypothetical protein
MAEKWAAAMKSSFTNDPDAIKRYVINHVTAHPVRGISWGELYYSGLVTPKLFNFTKTWCDIWNERFNDPGDHALDLHRVGFGLRQRSPKFDLAPYITFILEQSRQIGYMPGSSSGGPFFPHDKQVAIMRKIFDYYEGILGCKIYSPKTEGGMIYSLLRDAFLEGKALLNFDVSGMELITPSILNGQIGKLRYGLGAVTSYLASIPELLSGVLPTSDLDMIAHLELLSRLLVGDIELIVILGDDATIVMRSGYIKLSPLYDQQLADQRIHRTLGLAVGKLMHPVGLNLTIDDAPKVIRLHQGHWVVNKMPLPERWKVAELFTGFVNGVPLHDIMRKAPAQEDWYSPKQFISKITSTVLGS